MFSRYLKKQTVQDLNKKMVIIGGPRQVGKTTLAKEILEDRPGYLNWDIPEQREAILKRQYPVSDLLVFDEIHKYRSWRNYLKGLYDGKSSDLEILVTGSARLDYYRHGGDSLQGRYHYLRFFPLSVAELDIVSANNFIELLTLGGFPEPFFGSSDIESRRWSREYRKRLLYDDLQTLEQVRDLGNIELLMLRLPDLVGSPLSINALREDLQVSHKAVANWLNILERLYGIFRLSPFGAPKIRAVKKEQKHYHVDWALVKDEAFRFENMVAVHLLKWVCFLEDTQGREMELRYFRDVDKREVDFVITEDMRPTTFIECKWNDAPIGNGLKYLKTRFPECDSYQISAIGRKDYVSADNIRVCPAVVYLANLI